MFNLLRKVVFGVSALGSFFLVTVAPDYSFAQGAGRDVDVILTKTCGRALFPVRNLNRRNRSILKSLSEGASFATPLFWQKRIVAHRDYVKGWRIGYSIYVNQDLSQIALHRRGSRGGVLNFVVGGKIPSYDGHRETTFGMLHPIAPFYSLLIRVNPDNPSSPTDFVCDICAGEVPKPTEGGTKYTFNIRREVKFHDGTPLTAHDIVATYKKIMFPPEGIASSRKAFFKMVDSVSAPYNFTVVFKLKFPSGAFIPAVATPFNFIYSKKDLDTHGYTWHKKNINGTGAFSFVQHQPGSFVEGKAYPRYHHIGKPYLDGYKAIAAPKMAMSLQAIRGGRAAIDFRGFRPKHRDDLVKALGSGIRIQETASTCLVSYAVNPGKAPFSDPRFRKAMATALDYDGAASRLGHSVGIMPYTSALHPSDPAASGVSARSLLGEHHQRMQSARKLLSGNSFDLMVPQNDEMLQIARWLVEEWRTVGLHVSINRVSGRRYWKAAPAIAKCVPCPKEAGECPEEAAYAMILNLNSNGQCPTGCTPDSECAEIPNGFVSDVR